MNKQKMVKGFIDFATLGFNKEDIDLKTTYYTILRSFFIVFAFLAIVFGSKVFATGKPLYIAVVPFKINAEKDLTFLKDGIIDMFSSRLSWEEKVKVVSGQEMTKVLEAVDSPLNESKAQKIGVELGADYVLFGSLTVFGNSVSIDAKVVDVSGNKPSLAFFNQIKGVEEVIPEINLIASDINEKVFGRTIPSKKVPVTSQGTWDQPGQFWKSQNFKHLINGMALGDIDDDGRIETVIITPRAVHIYRYEENRLVKTEEIPESRNRNFIGVDVADINGNGYAEIFVTSLDAQKNDLTSFVLEYNGQKFNKIVKKSPWYYRVAELPGRGRVLFGQRQKMTGDNPFLSAIFEMAWQNSDYVPENKLLPPKQANLMGFTFGNAMNIGQDVAVVYDKSDRIRIVEPSGKVVWTSSERYGGSTLYFSLPRIDRESENPIYLPMCIHIRDLDADGKYEVIAARNYGGTGRLLERFRKFTESHIEVLSWNGLGLADVWKTSKISGHIRDFEIGDFDNDGKDELVAAVIMKEGSMVLTTPESSLIAYELK
jgi:TolB-like protein